MLTPSQYLIDEHGTAHVLSSCIDLETWSFEVAAEFPNAHVINIRDFVEDEAEVRESRPISIASFILGLSGSSRRAYAPALGLTLRPAGRTIRTADPVGALANCDRADVLTRTATFLTAAGRALEATELARRAAQAGAA